MSMEQKQFFEAGRRAERERIIEILENIPPGSGLMGDDIGLAIELLRGEN
jgi:hypothetical protein